MQFMPMIYNGAKNLDVLNVFDQGNLLFISYDNAARNTSGAVDTMRY